MIPFLDQDNDTVYLDKEEIARALKAMANPPGWYILVPLNDDMQKVGGNTVVQIKASKMPAYSKYVVGRKRARWDREQRKTVSGLKQNNPKGLVITPQPFVLKMPWLRLKNNECHAIYVD